MFLRFGVVARASGGLCPERACADHSHGAYIIRMRWSLPTEAGALRRASSAIHCCLRWCWRSTRWARSRRFTRAAMLRIPRAGFVRNARAQRVCQRGAVASVAMCFARAGFPSYTVFGYVPLADAWRAGCWSSSEFSVTGCLAIMAIAAPLGRSTCGRSWAFSLVDRARRSIIPSEPFWSIFLLRGDTTRASVGLSECASDHTSFRLSPPRASPTRRSGCASGPSSRSRAIAVILAANILHPGFVPHPGPKTQMGFGAGNRQPQVGEHTNMKFIKKKKKKKNNKKHAIQPKNQTLARGHTSRDIN